MVQEGVAVDRAGSCRLLPIKLGRVAVGAHWSGRMVQGAAARTALDHKPSFAGSKPIPLVVLGQDRPGSSNHSDQYATRVIVRWWAFVRRPRPIPPDVAVATAS